MSRESLQVETLPNAQRAEQLTVAAFAELEQQHDHANRWASTVLLTTNEQVQDRQISLVDATSSQEPHYKAYLKLDNWAHLYGQHESDGDQPYWFQTAGSEQGSAWSALQARIIALPNSEAALIHSETDLSVANMVEIRIPSDGTDTQQVARTLNETIHALTGEELWDDNIADDSFAAWKTNTYRAYHKLGEGPLTPAQQMEAHALQIERTSWDRIALTQPGQHDNLGLEYAAGDKLRLVHEMRRIDDAIDVIEAGGLLSTLQRLERGNTFSGRSSAADIMTGGADAIYAYAKPEAQATETFSGTHSVHLVFKPSVLDRLDVRAYGTDGYGSKETTTRTVIHEATGAEPRDYVVTSYNDRVAPEDFGSLRGVHEVCVAGGVGTNELDSVVVDNELGEHPLADSYADIDWHKTLLPYTSPSTGNRGGEISRLANYIAEAWTTPEAASKVLERIGLPQSQAELITTGMELAPRDRMIAKLKKRGITEIAGKAVEDFVVAGTPYVRKN